MTGGTSGFGIFDFEKISFSVVDFFVIVVPMILKIRLYQSYPYNKTSSSQLYRLLNSTLIDFLALLVNYYIFMFKKHTHEK